MYKWEFCGQCCVPDQQISDFGQSKFHYLNYILYVYIQDYGDLIRNISWNCNKECWQCLYPTVRPLAIVSIDVCHRMSNSPFSESRSSNNSVATDDKTLKAVYSALWNLALTSAKCREAMCSVNKFLNYLIKWLLEFENHMIFIEQVVGLSKCLVG